MRKMFLLGAVGYPVLELLYRRRTHYSMAIAGGLSAVFIRRVSRIHAGVIPQALLCAAGITCIEAACGLVWNRRYTVWDYRRIPLNWKGQICLPYSLLWAFLSVGMLTLMKRLPNHHSGRTK